MMIAPNLVAVSYLITIRRAFKSIGDTKNAMVILQMVGNKELVSLELYVS